MAAYGASKANSLAKWYTRLEFLFWTKLPFAGQDGWVVMAELEAAVSESPKWTTSWAGWTCELGTFR